MRRAKPRRLIDSGEPGENVPTPQPTLNELAILVPSWSQNGKPGDSNLVFGPIRAAWHVLVVVAAGSDALRDVRFGRNERFGRASHLCANLSCIQ